jgi:hypothetical protein
MSGGFDANARALIKLKIELKSDNYKLPVEVSYSTQKEIDEHRDKCVVLTLQPSPKSIWIDIESERGQQKWLGLGELWGERNINHYRWRAKVSRYFSIGLPPSKRIRTILAINCGQGSVHDMTTTQALYHVTLARLAEKICTRYREVLQPLWASELLIRYEDSDSVYLVDEKGAKSKKFLSRLPGQYEDFEHEFPVSLVKDLEGQDRIDNNTLVYMPNWDCPRRRLLGDWLIEHPDVRPLGFLCYPVHPDPEEEIDTDFRDCDAQNLCTFIQLKGYSRVDWYHSNMSMLLPNTEQPFVALGRLSLYLRNFEPEDAWVPL